MKAPSRLRPRMPIASFAAVTLLAMGAAVAQVSSTPADTSGNYRLEVQACKSGNTQQDRATCLEEARNAHADKQRGALDKGGSATQFEANARARCDVFKDAESKAACEARVMGYGSVTGSVAGGGLLREVETVVLPPGQESVTIEPKTPDPVLLVPVPATRQRQ